MSGPGWTRWPRTPPAPGRVGAAAARAALPGFAGPWRRCRGGSPGATPRSCARDSRAARSGSGARPSSSRASGARDPRRPAARPGRTPAAHCAAAAPAGSDPRSGSDAPGPQLDRLDQRRVPGDRPVVCPVQPDDLGQHVRIAGIALRARGRVPLPIPRHRHRVDREHLYPAASNAGTHGPRRSRSRPSPARPPPPAEIRPRLGTCPAISAAAGRPPPAPPAAARASRRPSSSTSSTS